MPNDYFQFKQFIIYQDKCSMKVCTDACIFGAWVAKIVTGDRLRVTSCLDIGAGTGLLSLMLAQSSPAIIDAIEIDDDSFEQLTSNLKISQWSDTLISIHADAKIYTFNKKYDLIISNPPFYENDLLSPMQPKNIAKHNNELNLTELISIVKNQLHSRGNFAVLLPFHRLVYFEKLAGKNHFFLEEKLLIKHTVNHEYFRAILIFNKQQTKSCEVKELIIKNEDETYSDQFIKLMKDYYITL